MVTRDFLGIIASALETASKQVRMLAAEMDTPMTAQDFINRINQHALQLSGTTTDDSASKGQG